MDLSGLLKGVAERIPDALTESGAFLAGGQPALERRVAFIDALRERHKQQQALQNLVESLDPSMKGIAVPLGTNPALFQTEFLQTGNELAPVSRATGRVREDIPRLPAPAARAATGMIPDKDVKTVALGLYFADHNAMPATEAELGPYIVPAEQQVKQKRLGEIEARRRPESEKFTAITPNTIGFMNRRGAVTMLPDEVRKQISGKDEEKKAAQEKARTDRSYDKKNAELVKLSAPFEAQLTNLTKLADTLNQMTPAADSFVAPEMLTAMAGGQGSGLRMNEAEIARIVGGRSSLENLKANLNRLQLDPKKALSITPAQRQQMRQLIAVAQSKAQHRLSIIEKAGDELIDAPSADEQRRIVARAKKALHAVNTSALAPPPDALLPAQRNWVEVPQPK